MSGQTAAPEQLTSVPANLRGDGCDCHPAQHAVHQRIPAGTAKNLGQGDRADDDATAAGTYCFEERSRPSVADRKLAQTFAIENQ